MPPLILAPMAGVATPALRTLCEEMGAGLTFTEMVPVDGFVRGAPRVARLVQPSRGGRPFGVQLCGHRLEELEESAARLSGSGALVIDVNMGCPARKVVKGGSGAALMRDPFAAAQRVHAVKRGAGPGIMVSAKMRTGWDEESRNVMEVATAVVEAGCNWVTVHGRTRKQGFAGPVDYESIGAVVSALNVPVVGNGDVRDPASMNRMLSETGCAAVMVGRGALGRPWMFRELRAALDGAPAFPEMTLEERRRFMVRHLELYLHEAEPARAVLEMRKHLAWYSKGVHGSAAFRSRLYRIQDVDRVREHIQTLGQSGK